MSIGHGMIWPLAAEYARRGWAVRRVNWADEVTNLSGNHPQPSSLRWIVHHSGLFHLTYLNRGDDFIVGSVSRVVRNTDFGVDEFYANDWTVFSPSCSATPAPDQQGKLWYPGAVDDEPYDDPTAPGTGDQSCPEVPPIFDDPPPDDGGIGGGDNGNDGGGGGSGGGGGGGGPRPPRPPPNLDPAQIIIENVTWTPQCFADDDTEPFQIQLGFRVRLGAAPTPFANGLYWISVYVHGKKIDAPSWTPGTAVDYSVAVQQDLGKPVLIRANAYLPIKRIQSNARHEFNFPEMCPPPPMTITISDGSPHPGENLSGTSHSGWFIAKYLDEFDFSAELTSATIDNAGTVAGVSVDNGSNDPPKLSTLPAPVDCTGGVTVEVQGDQARFTTSYSVNNFAPGGDDWLNPSSISATVVVTWKEKAL